MIGGSGASSDTSSLEELIIGPAPVYAPPRVVYVMPQLLYVNPDGTRGAPEPSFPGATGPYKVSEYTPGKSLHLVRNDQQQGATASNPGPPGDRRRDPTGPIVPHPGNGHRPRRRITGNHFHSSLDPVRLC